MSLSLPLLIGLGLAGLILWGLIARPNRQTVAARNLRIIDGDTLWIADQQGQILEKLRLATIDAPETRGFKSLWQGRAGEAAKAALAQIIHRADEIEIVRVGYDRYGRTLVKLYDRQHSRHEIGAQMERAGYARHWD